MKKHVRIFTHMVILEGFAYVKLLPILFFKYEYVKMVVTIAVMWNSCISYSAGKGSFTSATIKLYVAVQNCGFDSDGIVPGYSDNLLVLLTSWRDFVSKMGIILCNWFVQWERSE